MDTNGIDSNEKKDNEKYKLIPTKLKFLKNIVNDSFSKFIKMNTFSIFNSIYDILYLVYSTENISLILYNMIDNKKIGEIKNSHNKYITNIRHYLDNYNKRDLIISISLEDNNLKLWNINNYDCLLNIENVNNNGRLFSACFLNDNDKIYIITSNVDEEPIKIFDLNGKIVKKINNYCVHFIDTYYDINNSKIYILTCNKDCIKSYDYINNKEYHIYSELNKKELDDRRYKVHI